MTKVHSLQSLRAGDRVRIHREGIIREATFLRLSNKPSGAIFDVTPEYDELIFSSELNAGWVEIEKA